MDSGALQTQAEGAEHSLTDCRVQEELQGNVWRSEQNQGRSLGQSALGTTWLEGQKDPLVSLPNIPFLGQDGASAPLDLGIGGKLLDGTSFMGHKRVSV